MKAIVNEISVEYQDEGQGPVVLMLHGWGNTLHVFDAIVPALAQNRRIVRMDLPGFGATEVPPRPWNVEDYARFVAAFCEKLKLNIDVLVGYSLGGRIIIKGVSHGILSSHRCVLISAAGVAERRTVRNRAYAAVAKIGKILLEPLPKSMYIKARRLLYTQTGSDYLTIASMSETFRHVVQEDLSLTARGISMPALLIWGADDLVTPLHEGKKLNSLIRGSRLTSIPHASHFVLQEKPEEVSKLIQDFIL
jgi:pimeloyl-ACP methyl ester carboxylesterase